MRFIRFTLNIKCLSVKITQLDCTKKKLSSIFSSLNNP